MMAIDEQIARAIGGHTLWTARIQRALDSGKSEFTPTDVAKDDLCTFGKWLGGGSLSPAERHSEGFRTVRHLHSEFHRVAGSTMERALAGDDQQVATDLRNGVFSQATTALFAAMFQWQRATAAQCGDGSAGVLNRLCMWVRSTIRLRIWLAVAIPSAGIVVCLVGADRQLSALIAAIPQESTKAMALSGYHLLNTVIAGAAILGGGIIIGLARSVSRPISQLSEATRRIAEGHLDIQLPGMNRADEIGDLARAVLVFQQQAAAVERIAAAQEQQREKSEAERRDALIVMAANIESQTAAVVGRIADESTHVHDTAKRMASGAASVEENAQRVAAAAEQSLSNAETVAGSTEELSASIREIASQVERSRAIVGEAVVAADNASTTVNDLGDAMAAIDQVVQLIAEIASQTNLLALNATIEAARAGEAGKGFAVVANEVKLLANQTARQTGEISQRIGTLKEMAARVRLAIVSTVGCVKGVEEIANAVAVSVEEQDVATKEIARSVQQSAKAAREVTDRILEVADEAIATGQQSGQLETMLDDMAAEVAELRQVLNRVVRTATPDVDRRTTRRYTVAASAALQSRTAQHPGQLADISVGGARLRSDADFPVSAGESGTLLIDGIDIPVSVIESAHGYCRLKMHQAGEAAVDRWIERHVPAAA